MTQLELVLPVSIADRRAGGVELPTPDGSAHCSRCARELGRRQAVMPVAYAGSSRVCLVCGDRQPRDRGCTRRDCLLC